MNAIKISERFLAVVVFVATFVYGVQSAIYLFGLDWSLTKSFYEFINRALLVSVGIELVRLLFTHDVHAITDLLVFAVARKLLRPDIATSELVIYVAAFALLIFADAVVDKIRFSMEKKSHSQ